MISVALLGPHPRKHLPGLQSPSRTLKTADLGAKTHFCCRPIFLGVSVIISLATLLKNPSYCTRTAGFVLFQMRLLSLSSIVLVFCSFITMKTNFLLCGPNAGGPIQTYLAFCKTVRSAHRKLDLQCFLCNASQKGFTLHTSLNRGEIAWQPFTIDSF